jgi:chromosome segregation ATPase
LKHYWQKRKEYEKALAEVAKKRDAAQREVDEMVAKAKQIHEEPVRTRRTPQNLESEILQIQKQIAHEQKSRGDPEEIRRIYFEKKKQYQSVKDESDSLMLFTEKLTKMLKNREVCYAKMRDSLSIVLGMCFARNLGVRNNFSGSLKVDHKEKVIDMIVYPRNEAKSSDMASNRSLSGGERTFATTCFILSLWDNMEVPFRCLDEFDVFMDLVNRRLCMDMMIRAAALKPGCQFVFLSPLNMSQLNLDVGAVDVKIFEMAAPREEAKKRSSDEQ